MAIKYKIHFKTLKLNECELVEEYWNLLSSENIMYKETLYFWMGRQDYKEESIPTLVLGFYCKTP